MEGQPQPKIGIEEFISIAERFGFTAEAIERIRSVIDVTDLGIGPTLSKYATSYPPTPKAQPLRHWRVRTLASNMRWASVLARRRCIAP